MSSEDITTKTRRQINKLQKQKNLLIEDVKNQLLNDPSSSFYNDANLYKKTVKGIKKIIKQLDEHPEDWGSQKKLRERKIKRILTNILQQLMFFN